MYGDYKKALENNDVKAFREAIDKGREAGLYDPILFASYWKYYGMVELLLKDGSNPNARDIYNFGDSALHMAVDRDNEDIRLIKLLLSYGAKQVKNHHGETPLEEYVKYKKLYKSKNEVETAKEKEIIDLLTPVETVEVPTDVFECAVQGDPVNMRKVLEKDPDHVWLMNLFDFTPLGEAVTYTAKEKYEFDMPQEQKEAKYKQRLECIKVMLEFGADPNVNCENGGHIETPLSIAIEKKDIEAIKLLLDNGADPNHPIDFEVSPLVHAVQSCMERMDIIKLLLDKGADINYSCEDDPDYSGYTALHHAAIEGELELVKMLLQYGADTKVQNCDGETPLDLVVEYADVDDDVKNELISLLGGDPLK